MVAEMIQPVRRASRMWVRARGTALAIIGLVALGIGGVAALFTPLHTLVLAPLPLPEPNQLVRIGGEIPVFNVYTNALESQGRAAGLFASVAAYAPVSGAGAEATFAQGSRPRRIAVLAVTPAFFETLGVRPRMGPSLAGEATGSKAVIVSDRLWRSEFAADRELGTTMELGRQERSVVGVMPAGFDFPGGVDAWVLIGSTSYVVTGLQSIGRLRAGLSIDQAMAELKVMGYKPAFGPSGQFAGRGPLLQRLQTFLRGDHQNTLWMLAAVSGLFLTLACVGVANVLLAQGVRRRRAVVVQLALGAGRWRLVKDLLIETLVVVTAGALLGLWLSTVAGRWLRTQLPELQSGPLLAPATFAVVAALTVLVTLLCGLAPALYNTRAPLGASLRSAGSHRSFAPREWLAVAQLALALALLTGTGLLLRSLTAHLNRPLGLDTENVAAFRLELPASPARVDVIAKFRQEHGAPRPGRSSPALAKLLEPHFRAERMRNAEFLRDAQDSLERLPGVAAAGVLDPTPFTREAELLRHLVYLATPAGGRDDSAVRAMIGRASQDGFDLLGIRMLAGRGFEPADVAAEVAARNADPSDPSAEAAERARVRVAIVNEALARRLWPDENPIGKQFRESGTSLPVHTVVGVVSNFTWTADGASSGPAVYFPFTAWDGSIGFVVRLRGGMPVEQFRADVDRIMSSLMPGIPQVDVHSMQALTQSGLRTTRFATTLLVAFSLLGIIVASLGVYTASALMAASRTREIGIRIALGATAASVRRMALTRSLMLAAVAVPAGLLAGWLLARQLRHLLFLVTPTDPATYAISVLALLAVALGAGLVPAVRAGATDPVIALRNE